MGVDEYAKLFFGFELEKPEVQRIRPLLLKLAAQGALGEPDEGEVDPDDLDDLAFAKPEGADWEYPFDFIEWVEGMTALAAVSPVAQYLEAEELEAEPVYLGIELVEADPKETGEHAVSFDQARLGKMDDWLRKLAKELKLEQEPRVWLLMCAE